MMETPLRVGLAGLGSMGRNHLRHLVARRDVRLVAVADPVVSLVDLAPEQHDGVSSFQSPEVMLDEVALDALIVAVPTTFHHAVAGKALDMGIAVLVEKPLSATLAEGEDLIARARSSGAVLQVGHIERFNPAVIELAQRLRGGALSRIFTVRTVRGGPLPPRIRDVGVAIDLATHDLDIICHLLHERPVRGYAETTRRVHTDHEDLLYGVLSFPSGAMAQIDVNWLTPEKQRSITVLGQEGMFHVDLLRQTLTFTRGDADLTPTYLDGFTPMFAGHSVFLPVRPAEPLMLELDGFFEAVRTKATPPITGEDGLSALTLAQQLLSSAAEHRAVPMAAHTHAGSPGR
jgi:UDP-N-acetylglucosamine 3-dehydrogenase